MFFMLSGEGPTDLGTCANAGEHCSGDDYMIGPLAILVDKIVVSAQAYSPREAKVFTYVPRQELVRTSTQMRPLPKAAKLPGKKREKETLYFYNNARALARLAMANEKEKSDDAVAILFRDADTTASSDRGEWSKKFDSILNGFAAEKFTRGVPMVANPKSEAWILCATKYDYRCDLIEDRSGNESSTRPLKDELSAYLGRATTRETLCEIVDETHIDPNRINVPSFVRFRVRLLEAL